MADDQGSALEVIRVNLPNANFARFSTVGAWFFEDQETNKIFFTVEWLEKDVTSTAYRLFEIPNTDALPTSADNLRYVDLSKNVAGALNLGDRKLGLYLKDMASGMLVLNTDTMTMEQELLPKYKINSAVQITRTKFVFSCDMDMYVFDKGSVKPLTSVLRANLLAYDSSKQDLFYTTPGDDTPTLHKYNLRSQSEKTYPSNSFSQLGFIDKNYRTLHTFSVRENDTASTAEIVVYTMPMSVMETIPAVEPLPAGSRAASACYDPNSDIGYFTLSKGGKATGSSQLITKRGWAQTIFKVNFESMDKDIAYAFPDSRGFLWMGTIQAEPQIWRVPAHHFAPPEDEPNPLLNGEPIDEVPYDQYSDTTKPAWSNGVTTVVFDSPPPAQSPPSPTITTTTTTSSSSPAKAVSTTTTADSGPQGSIAEHEGCYLSICIFAASNLKAVNDDHSNPYVIVSNFGGGDVRTHVKSHTLNPMWQEEFLPRQVRFTETIKFSVFSSATFLGSDDFLGQASIRVDEIRDQMVAKHLRYYDHRFTLGPRDSMSEGDISGKLNVLFTLGYVDLQLTLVKAEELVPVHGDGTCNATVHLTAANTAVKSKTIKRSTSPEWNEEFYLRELSALSVVKMEVWDDDVLGVTGPTFLGSYSLDMRTITSYVLNMKKTEMWCDLESRPDKDDIVSGKVLVRFALEPHGLIA